MKTSIFSLILFLAIPLHSFANTLTTFYPSRICRQATHTLATAMTHGPIYTEFSSAPILCDRATNGIDFPNGVGIGPSSTVGWSGAVQSGSDQLREHYRTFLYYTPPIATQYSRFSKVSLVINTTSSVTGYSQETPVLQIFVSPALISANYVKWCAGDGSINNPVNQIPLTGEYFIVPTTIINDKIIADIPIYLWAYLSNSGFALSATIVPENIFAGEAYTAVSGFSFDVIGVNRPYLVIEEFETGTGDPPFGEDVPDRDREAPVVQFAEFSFLWPDECENELQPIPPPVSIPAGINNKYNNLQKPAANLPEFLLDKDNTTFDCLTVLDATAVESAFSVQEAYVRPYPFKDNYYNLGIAIDDNVGLRNVKIKINDNEVYSWEITSSYEIRPHWPFNYRRPCGTTSTSTYKSFSDIINGFKPKFTSKDINVPVNLMPRL